MSVTALSTHCSKFSWHFRGILLFNRCTRKELAAVLTDDDERFVIQLNFMPSGRLFNVLKQFKYSNLRPNTESEKYYIKEKENQCVVCRSEKSLIRKNVVPREYRKHFPTVMKCHVSHDIVLLCLKVSNYISKSSIN